MTTPIALPLPSWTRPPSHFVKCNFDASFNTDSFTATGGWLIRNHCGITQSWTSALLPQTASPLEAETRCLLAALQHTWARGYSKVIFEGDCEVLINNLTGRTKTSSITNLLKDVKYWSSKFKEVRFVFIRRSCNEAAHVLARFGCNTCTFYSATMNPPPWLEQKLCNDYQSSI